MDIRTDAAQYYDLVNTHTDDIAFYTQRVPSLGAEVLELGCGTGRVLVPLARLCSYIRGVDKSSAMLAVCRAKMRAAGLVSCRARVEAADISRLHLRRTFDWIIAPFRVLQNLETDEEVEGLFDSIRAHLAPGGSCILNVFHPHDRERVFREWPCDTEVAISRKAVNGRTILFSERLARIDKQKMILYPDLIHRVYENGALVDEVVLKIVMRCYYPEEFRNLIVSHGFKIVGQWGGYAGQPYGQGPELVIEFTA